MSKLSKETIKALGSVQELLKNMYQTSEKKLEQHKDEWKHPQDEDDANRTLVGYGFAKGAMEATTHVSKFINDLVDAQVVKEQKQNKDKWIDFKKGKNTNGMKEVSVDEIPEEDKKEILLALAQAFGFAPEQEEEDD